MRLFEFILMASTCQRVIIIKCILIIYTFSHFHREREKSVAWTASIIASGAKALQPATTFILINDYWKLSSVSLYLSPLPSLNLVVYLTVIFPSVGFKRIMNRPVLIAGHSFLDRDTACNRNFIRSPLSDIHTGNKVFHTRHCALKIPI